MLATLIGALLIFAALLDNFESMVLPRRVTRRWRPTRLYYRSSWTVWRSACRLFQSRRYHENALGVFGPLSLLGLFACWAIAIITGFALIHWGSQTLSSDAGKELRQCFYHSGETFFTLGYGDITPASYTGKFLAVLEAGIGFGFMAIVIGYLPVLYQAFSRRELNIALLDARAGSPPTAGELLRRVGRSDHSQEMDRYLVDWEIWAGELLESHLSFPVLGFYRSQHDNQSWLATLALILDASAIHIVISGERCRRRAELTFAMARHACVDLCLIFWLPPIEPKQERLSPAELTSLFSPDNESSDTLAEQTERLCELRQLYEPFLEALSQYFEYPVPRFFPERQVSDNWQSTPWTKRAPGITDLPVRQIHADDHFG